MTIMLIHVEPVTAARARTRMHGLNGRPQDEGIVGDPDTRIADDVTNAPCDCMHLGSWPPTDFFDRFGKNGERGKGSAGAVQEAFSRNVGNQ